MCSAQIVPEPSLHLLVTRHFFRVLGRDWITPNGARDGRFWEGGSSSIHHFSKFYFLETCSRTLAWRLVSSLSTRKSKNFWQKRNICCTICGKPLNYTANGRGDLCFETGTKVAAWNYCRFGFVRALFSCGFWSFMPFLCSPPPPYPGTHPSFDRSLKPSALVAPPRSSKLNNERRGPPPSPAGILRAVRIPADLVEQFTQAARENTEKKNIETCGNLWGRRVSNSLSSELFWVSQRTKRKTAGLISVGSVWKVPVLGLVQKFEPVR